MKYAQPAIKIPRDAFDACPSCLSDADLRSRSIDVFCVSCGWDNSSAFVDSGGLDALINEFERREAPCRKRASGRQSKRNSAQTLGATV